MFKRALSIIGLVSLLALALLSAGCSSKSGLADMMARVPDDATNIKYVDVAALRKDGDLDGLYEAWKTAAGPKLEALGIDRGAVVLFATGGNIAEQYTLVTGKFDLEGMRDELDDRNYDDTEYKDVEVWKKDAGLSFREDFEVALMGDLIIFGNEAGVESCIRVLKEGDDSLMDSADAKDVAHRLSEGVYAELQASELAGLMFSGLEASGISVAKMNKDTLKISGAAKFEDEGDAEDARDGVDDYLEQSFYGVDVDQQGIFLTATAKVDIDDAESMFGSL